MNEHDCPDVVGCDHEIDPTALHPYRERCDEVIVIVRCARCGRGGRLSPDAGLEWAADQFGQDDDQT